MLLLEEQHRTLAGERSDRIVGQPQSVDHEAGDDRCDEIDGKRQNIVTRLQRERERQRRFKEPAAERSQDRAGQPRSETAEIGAQNDRGIQGHERCAKERLGRMVHIASSARDVRGSLESGIPVVRLARPGHHVDPEGPEPTLQADGIRELPALLPVAARALDD